MVKGLIVGLGCCAAVLGAGAMLSAPATHASTSAPHVTKAAPKPASAPSDRSEPTTLGLLILGGAGLLIGRRLGKPARR